MTFPQPELLLHTIIPPPLHGLAPRTIKGNGWWDQQRHAAAAKNMYRCWACNIPKAKAKKHQWLEGHESYDIDWRKGRSTLVEIVSLCHYCHNYIHHERLRVLVEYGKESLEFLNDVRRHGDNLTAHLKKPVIPSSAEIAQWQEWVMIVDGIPYSSRFKSASEWETYYHWLNTTDQHDSKQNLERFRHLFEKCPPLSPVRAVADLTTRAPQ